MKRSFLFSGIALLGITFSAAAFTAKKDTATSHYIQKPGVCQAIPQTSCEPGLPTCSFNDGTGTYGVYQVQLSPQACDIELELQ